MTSTPWPAVLRLAADRFRLPPREVWALSLREWRALVGRSSGETPLTRADLDALLLLHPDDPP